MTIAHTDTVWPPDVLTLSIDIGGSGFKASIVNTQGVMTTERVRIETPYPCPPDRLVETLTHLVAPLRTCIASRSDTSRSGGRPPLTVTQTIGVAFRFFTVAESSARKLRSTRSRSGRRSSAARFFAATKTSSGRSSVVFICIYRLP